MLWVWRRAGAKMDRQAASRPLGWRRLALACAAASLGGMAVGLAPARADDPLPATAGPSATDATSLSVPYQPELIGLDAQGENAPLPDGLTGPLQGASLTFKLVNEPPATVLALRRRADGDAQRLLDVLASQGFYAARVQPVVDSRESPALVQFRIKPGPQYQTSTLTIDYGQRAEEARQAGLPQSAADVGVKLGGPALASPMLDALDSLERALQDQGYPNGQITEKKFVVDHASQTLSARFVVAMGQPVVYGTVSFHGLETVEEGYLRRSMPLQPGERWSQQEVEAYRRSLLNEGLFDSATISRRSEAPQLTSTDAAQVADLDVQVQEAEHRTLGAGARYSTTLGPSAKAFWEHRNLFGENEDFEVAAELGMLHSELSGQLRTPHFFQRNQTWVVESSLSDSSYEAYDETALDLSTGLEQPLSDHWRGSLGVSFEQSEITDVEGTHNSSLLGFPLRLTYDQTDSRLDPRKGVRLTLQGTPYTGYYEGPVAFVSVRGDLTSYVPLDDARRFVFASRLSVGSLLGASRTGVPAAKRFYAGGGGSIRGYGYQMAGPLDAEGDPAGGKAVLETGIELRVKVTDDIELVPFVEGGRAYEDSQISMDETPFWGAGLGVRYHTSVGPLRLDIAVPLDARTNVDDPWQFYVSLGQAF